LPLLLLCEGDWPPFPNLLSHSRGGLMNFVAAALANDNPHRHADLDVRDVGSEDIE
jgi:hypothetical protein